MGHFALLDEDNIVLNVIVVDDLDIQDENGIEKEEIGIKFCNNIFTGNWIQTSRSSKFRKKFAEKGDSYDKERDAFISPKPYESWLFNESTCQWEPPVPNKYKDFLSEYGQVGGEAIWREDLQKWEYTGPKWFDELLERPPLINSDLSDLNYLFFTGVYPGD